MASSNRVNALALDERMELERLRDEARERREAHRVKERLLEAVAHELRSPLTVSQAAIAGIADGFSGPLTATQAEFIEMAQRNLDRAGRLILSALDYARLPSGADSVDLRRVDAGRLIAEAAADWKPSLAKHLIIRVELEGSPPPARADPDHAASVLGLLFDAAALTARRELSVRAREKDGMLRITVEDDAEEGTAGKGADLCAAIGHEIARRGEGRVRLERTAGGRARLHFELPRWSDQSAAGAGGTP